MQDVRLWVLVRNDSHELTHNPGKIAAQVAHAATKLVLDGNAKKKLIKAWAEDRGFGTKIVLSVSPEDMYQAALLANEVDGLVSGVVHDPSFPVHDGSILHCVPLDTCSFVFGMKSVAQIVVGNFPLMRMK